MKSKKIYISLAFLIVFLFSFTIHTLTISQNSSKNSIHFSKDTELQEAVPVANTENLIFEEKGKKESLNPLSTLLPAFLRLSFYYGFDSAESNIDFPSALNSGPLFLSIRVLKI